MNKPIIGNLRSKVHDLSSPIRCIRRFSVLQCMEKDRDLETSLIRNRRWIFNNQIKNVILGYPDENVPIKYIQKKFKILNALNWLKKYPCCFDVSHRIDKDYCRLSKMMKALVEEENAVKDSQEPVFARRLAKLLMMSSNRRLSMAKLNMIKTNFGFPDDYLLRIVPTRPDMFRIVSYGGMKNSMDIQLVSWDPKLAVSAIEASARKQGTDPHIPCSFPLSGPRIQELDTPRYVSPYSDPSEHVEGSRAYVVRAIGLVHELLSLSIWKKASVLTLAQFNKEFALPMKLNELLLRHPKMFYVTNKYKINTVLLREAYKGSELIEKDPLVVVKNKFGDLMECGIHEFKRRRRLANLEKMRMKTMLLERKVKVKKHKKIKVSDSDDDDEKDKVRGLFDPEERKRFYRVLFEEDAP